MINLQFVVQTTGRIKFQNKSDTKVISIFIYLYHSKNSLNVNIYGSVWDW